MASRYCRTPDWARPSWMIRSTFLGFAASALSARAIAPVSRWARYSTPAGERYSTAWPAAEPAVNATATNAAVRRIINSLSGHGNADPRVGGAIVKEPPSLERHETLDERRALGILPCPLVISC